MSQIERSLQVYVFGPFSLNVRERLLLRGPEVIPLSPKVFDTLVVLVENAGHALSKDELLNKLWPDSFVEESSLTQNVSILRKALGEDPARPQYIETIPKRGYRFIADVEEHDESETVTDNQERSDEPVLTGWEEVPAPDESQHEAQHLSLPPLEEVRPAEFQATDVQPQTTRRRWKL